mgnify:CR=1 FL=1
MYQPIRPVTGRPGAFMAFETLSDEAARAALLMEFDAVVERRSSTAEDCPGCHGRGVLRGENVGCPTCHGRGIVNE